MGTGAGVHLPVSGSADVVTIKKYSDGTLNSLVYNKFVSGQSSRTAVYPTEGEAVNEVRRVNMCLESKYSSENFSLYFFLPPL